MNNHHPRRRRLIKTGLQFRLIGAFGSVVLLALFCQFLLVTYFLGREAAQIEGVGGQLAELIPGVAMKVLGLSLLVILPAFFGLGVMITFRIAGPVYRFEQYLHSVASGNQLGPCRIREKDELHSLCAAINLATEAQRHAVRGGETAVPAIPAAERRSA